MGGNSTREGCPVLQVGQVKRLLTSPQLPTLTQLSQGHRHAGLGPTAGHADWRKEKARATQRHPKQRHLTCRVGTDKVSAASQPAGLGPPPGASIHAASTRGSLSSLGGELGARQAATTGSALRGLRVCRGQHRVGGCGQGGQGVLPEEVRPTLKRVGEGESSGNEGTAADGTGEESLHVQRAHGRRGGRRQD